ncbi:chalcone isomerase family protein [Ralstonia pseudosolanacearum]|uniref:chalcone isomerase family protein n=1 Tax=Ralstonia pseudosolanacearum TaxID=1310165 RepID=UPI001FFA4230|nr:chalcone isomerase family protein [Ralstonia pseudosolanacearum]
MFSTRAFIRRALRFAARARSLGTPRAWRRSVAGAALLAACAWPAWAAADIEGVRFDEAVRLAGYELPLNGTGLRSFFMIKGYVAGLYLPERAKNAAVILGMKGPKRLQIHPLRDVGADTFIHALVDGIHRNQTEAQVRKLADRLRQLEDAMRRIGTTRRGDTINVDYTPQAGTVLSVNGVARGLPIPGEDFYQAVLRIFIGDDPVDRDLKSGLLGT